MKQKKGKSTLYSYIAEEKEKKKIKRDSVKSSGLLFVRGPLKVNFYTFTLEDLTVWAAVFHIESLWTLKYSW